MKPLSELVQTLACQQCECGMDNKAVEIQIQERIDQEKAALREKITKDIKYIRNRTFKEDGMPVGENEDFVRACDEMLAILNAETLK